MEKTERASSFFEPKLNVRGFQVSKAQIEKLFSITFSVTSTEAYLYGGPERQNTTTWMMAVALLLQRVSKMSLMVGSSVPVILCAAL